MTIMVYLYQIKNTVDSQIYCSNSRSMFHINSKAHNDMTLIVDCFVQMRKVKTVIVMCTNLE